MSVADTDVTEAAAPELPIPSEELAMHVMRELEWGERIEGSIFDPGPGLVLQRIYRIRHLSNFLDAAQNFTVDMNTLQTWLRDTVGDPDLSDAVDAAIAAHDGTDAERRKAVADLLRLRVRQCEEILHEQGDE